MTKITKNKNCFENVSKIFDIIKNRSKIDIDYSSIKKIGKGSFGKVFKIEYLKRNATSKNDKIIFAIKLIDCEKKNAITSSKNEIIVLNKTRNKNILKTYGPIDSDILYSYENYNFILIEYFEYDLVKYTNNFYLGMSDLKIICKQIANGLNHLSEKEIIHTDIKSKNILISKKNNDLKVVICDFGLCRIVSKNSYHNECSNMDKITSLEYRAPELMIREKKNIIYNISIDYWSFGCILIELLRKIYFKYYYKINKSKKFLFGKECSIISIYNNNSNVDIAKNEEKLLKDIKKIIKTDLDIYLNRFKSIVKNEDFGIYDILKKIIKNLIKYDKRMTPKDILSNIILNE